MKLDIITRLNNALNKAKNEDDHSGKDFYVVLITAIHRILKQFKIIPLARKPYPASAYKQSTRKVIMDILFLKKSLIRQNQYQQIYTVVTDISLCYNNSSEPFLNFPNRLEQHESNYHCTSIYRRTT